MYKVIKETTPKNVIRIEDVSEYHIILGYTSLDDSYGILTESYYKSGEYRMRSLDKSFTRGNGWGSGLSFEEALKNFNNNDYWTLYVFDTMKEAIDWLAENM